MPRGIALIAADFEALALSDFDDSDPAATGRERLAILCEEALAIGDVPSCAPLLFLAIERLDGADLGSPGPFVHTLERWRGGYEPFLIESMKRKPTLLAVWMVNRILNAEPADSEMWMALLRSVARHSLASEAAVSSAQRFLLHRSSR